MRTAAELEELLDAAMTDTTAFGPLADRLEEDGEPILAALARFGMPLMCRWVMTAPRSPGGQTAAEIGRFLVASGLDPARYTLAVGPHMNRTIKPPSGRP